MSCRGIRKLQGRERYIEIIARLMPFTRWMRYYSFKKQFQNDFIAGLAVSFLIVPQGLSYAQVAGLPAQYGLCASQDRHQSAHSS